MQHGVHAPSELACSNCRSGRVSAASAASTLDPPLDFLLLGSCRIMHGAGQGLTALMQLCPQHAGQNGC